MSNSCVVSGDICVSGEPHDTENCIYNKIQKKCSRRIKRDKPLDLKSVSDGQIQSLPKQSLQRKPSLKKDLEQPIKTKLEISCEHDDIETLNPERARECDEIYGVGAKLLRRMGWSDKTDRPIIQIPDAITGKERPGIGLTKDRVTTELTHEPKQKLLERRKPLQVSAQVSTGVTAEVTHEPKQKLLERRKPLQVSAQVSTGVTAEVTHEPKQKLSERKLPIKSTSKLTEAHTSCVIGQHSYLDDSIDFDTELYCIKNQMSDIEMDPSSFSIDAEAIKLQSAAQVMLSLFQSDSPLAEKPLQSYIPSAQKTVNIRKRQAIQLYRDAVAVLNRQRVHDMRVMSDDLAWESFRKKIKQLNDEFPIITRFAIEVPVQIPQQPNAVNGSRMRAGRNKKFSRRRIPFYYFN
jgi:hypothetical protein